ncbi:cytochrome ubiquinol oxidase subunit II [Tropicimonas sp. IMCC34043]|uniref:cytochrome ubiquinol oxidase subunit II n=1 Tax=Tropicimonas sp. IMCC34043 TaxID=2248760 RepID=UPI001E580F5E|nr:cytochrome ubiquinol oxidase subunit II [Tropicimonas sp. IMCC34043]
MPPPRPQPAMTAAIPLAMAIALMAGSAQAGIGFLSPEGPVAALQREQFWRIIVITMIVVVPVLLGVPLLAWRYRHGNARARYAPHWDLSRPLEWVMWLVPAGIVVVLGTFLWQDTHKLDPYRPIAGPTPPLQVQVVGLDWKWLFLYPEQGIATVGELAFPQDRAVSLELTTDTVMQSFMIPQLVGQIYAMPGMRTKLNFAADQTGDFAGFNTQYNGKGFHEQRFAARAMEPAAFDAWVAEVKDQGVPLDAATYARLAGQSTPAEVRKGFGTAGMPEDVTYFSGIAPGLFDGVLGRYMSGRALADAAQPGAPDYHPQTSGE